MHLPTAEGTEIDPARSTLNSIYPSLILVVVPYVTRNWRLSMSDVAKSMMGPPWAGTWKQKIKAQRSAARRARPRNRETKQQMNKI